MAALPQELYDLIVSLVPDDVRTLKAISISSSILYPSAQRQLYYSYHPDRWSPYQLFTARDFSRFIHFLEAIIKNPTLATYVHEISCPLRPFGQRSLTWVEPLARAIPLTPNLKLLEIASNEGPYTDLLKSLVESNLILKVFQWKWFDPTPDPIDVQLMSTFLSHQTQLDSLSLYMSPITISKDSCPNLTQLITTCQNVLDILPGRPVQTLYLDPDDPALESISRHSPTVQGLRNIRCFSLDIATMLSNDMLRLFPNLEILTTEVATLQNPRDYNLIISHFPKLKTIHFIQNTSFSEQETMSHLLFHNLPKLRAVIWGQLQFNCWYSDFRSTPVLINLEQVDECMKLDV